MNPSSSSESLANKPVLTPTLAVSPKTGLTLQMRHPSTGESVQVPLGYSVPVLLLGPIVLLQRRDWRLAAVSLLVPILGQILLAPTANRSYLKLLVQRGFRAIGTEPGYVSRVEWELGMQIPRYTARSSKSDV